MNQTLAIVLVLLFFVVGNPMMYDIVDRVVPVKELGLPTQMGVFLHGLVFVFLLSLISSAKIFGKMAVSLK
mgnify:CR=1 FL=1